MYDDSRLDVNDESSTIMCISLASWQRIFWASLPTSEDTGRIQTGEAGAVLFEGFGFGVEYDEGVAGKGLIRVSPPPPTAKEKPDLEGVCCGGSLEGVGVGRIEELPWVALSVTTVAGESLAESFGKRASTKCDG